MGIIYCVVNIKNGKKYIGQTIRTLDQRKSAHLGRAPLKESYFHRALNKYGKYGFIWGIIEEVPDEELNAKEIYYIAKYETTDKTKGYNQKVGGEVKVKSANPFKKRPEKIFVCLYCHNNFMARSFPAYFCPTCKRSIGWKKRRQASEDYFTGTGETKKGNTEARRQKLIGPPRSLMNKPSKATGKPRGFPKGTKRTWDVKPIRTCVLCGKEFISTTGTAKFCPECKARSNEKTLNKAYKAKYGAKPKKAYTRIPGPEGKLLFVITCTTCDKPFVCGTITRSQCPECRGQLPTASCYMYEYNLPSEEGRLDNKEPNHAY